jgi:hypothetical protein
LPKSAKAGKVRSLTDLNQAEDIFSAGFFASSGPAIPENQLSGDKKEAPMDFNEMKLQQLDAATTYRLYGHAVKFEQDTAGSAATARPRWRLIRPCFCVQDSPENPCRCMIDSFFWLREDDIFAEGNAERKDHDGQKLQFFDVHLDSKIMVESLRPVSAGALKRLGDTISSEQLLEVASETATGLGVAYAKPKKVPKRLIDIILTLLGLVGDEIGLFDPIPWPPPGPH